MSAVAAATITAVAGVGGAIIGGKKAKDAAVAGADAQTIMNQENIEFQKWLWGEQKELTQPWVGAGERALKQYETEAFKPFTERDMLRDPGYQFRLSEGLKAVEGSAAAKGMQLSGSTLKGIGAWSQQFASDEFGRAYLRRQDRLNRLFDLSQTGANLAVGQATQGGRMGSEVGRSFAETGRSQAQMYSDLGNIQAAQWMAPGNVASDLFGSYALYKGMTA